MSKVGAAGEVISLLNQAQNIVNVGQGAADIAQNGVNVHNVTQLVSGIIGQYAHEIASTEAPSEPQPDGCGAVSNCFVAGTAVLVGEHLAGDSIATSIGMSSWPGFGIFASFSGEQREQLSIGLIVLGCWGAYLIQRTNHKALAKRARKELAEVEPVEMPVRHAGMQRRRLVLNKPGPFAGVFSALPIC